MDSIPFTVTNCASMSIREAQFVTGGIIITNSQTTRFASLLRAFVTWWFSSDITARKKFYNFLVLPIIEQIYSKCWRYGKISRLWKWTKSKLFPRPRG